MSMSQKVVKVRNMTLTSITGVFDNIKNARTQLASIP